MIDGHVNVSSQKYEDGTDLSPDALLAYMDEYGIEKAVVALGDDNEYISQVVSKHRTRLVGLASFDVRQTYFGMHKPCKGLEKAVSQLGLSGLKIHPSNMGIRPDDLSMMPLLRKAADMGIPVMIHSNPWGPGFYETSSPQYIDHIARIFPDLTIVMAHMGGTRFLDTAKMTGLNIWVETSSGLEEIAQIFGIRTAERVLRKIGLNKAMYGSDFPLPAKPQLKIINKMRLKEEEKERLLHQNAESVFFKQS